MEVSAATAPPDTRFHSDTYDLQNMKYSDVNHNWFWWPASNSWIDWPCGHAQNPPYCLNGIYNATAYWADNK